MWWSSPSRPPTKSKSYIGDGVGLLFQVYIVVITHMGDVPVVALK